MADLSKAIAGLDAKKRELLALLAKREGVSLSRAPIVPVDRGAGPLPLSFSQERLWFLHQLEPGYTGYNLPLAFQIDGRLDIAVLERAFNEIFRRHEALRTTFTLVDGKPTQVIAPPSPLPLRHVDLSEITDPTLAEREVRDHIHDETALPFDLERDAMLRLRLLRLGGERHVLIGTLHHIASDGWSLGVVISELVKLYEAFSAGRPSPLPELPIQYADFAAWQRQALSGQNLESQLDFWRQALGGDPPPLELPSDRPRPPVPGQRGTQYGVQVPPETASRLAALARAEEATLFMVLLAGFEVFLHRYSGQERFAVGTPIAGRNRVETEPLIGFFVNTLALRADLTGDPPFRELLARTRQVAVGSFGHQDLPFEKLVEELQPARDLSRTPIFQAVFSLQNTPPPTSYGLPELEFVQLSGDSVTALYDLTLTAAAEGEQELFLALNGRADLFEDATLIRMLRQIVVLFGGIGEDPGRPISEIPLLSPEEEQQVLLQGDGGAPAPGDLPVPLQVAEQARRTPEALAVAGEGLELTYRELVERADRLARHLRGLGVGPESVVAVRRERSPELIVEMLGIFLAGAAYLPLAPETPEERVSWVLNDSGATPSPALPRSAVEGAPALPEIVQEIGAGNLAYVIYTSGSTGHPKGVEIPHSGLANLVRWHREAFGVRPGDRASQLAGLGFDAAVWEIWPYLTAGASVHLVPEDVRLDPAALAGWLAEQRISHAFVPTPMVEGLEPRLARTPGGLRFLLTGGDRLHRGPERPLPFALINNYGPTEATVVATSGAVAAGGVRLPAIGQPIPGTRAYVLDAGFRLMPVGVPGDLYVGGAGLARGYRGRPDLTAERFRPDPFAAAEGDRLYATGDRVRWLADGGLDFLGRSDAQVKVRGFRIEPGEIEAVLASHPDVAEAAVLPREAAPGDVRLAAYVAMQNGDLEAVRDFLAARLPAYMVPASWKLLERLPLTPNGKVDRRALAAVDPGLDAARTGGSRFVAPRTPTEEAVAALFAELLRRPAGEVGAEDSFFDLGGHSLLASRLVSRLRERFEAGVSLRQVFENPTPASLAARIDSAQAPGTVPPPIRPRHAAPGEELPLSFAQQRLWFLDRMEPGGSFYNVPLAVRLAGNLDVAVLEHTLQEIARRHQVLRSVFPKAGGRAVQVVTPAARRRLPLVDLSALPEDTRRAEALRLATLEARRPFDLARGPLFRAGLLRLAPDDHAALLTLHHIVADGWSMGVLIRELGTLYSAFTAGRPSPLPELPIQYADFAAWQREWLEGEVLEQQLAYWRGQLAGAPAALDLPADHPRPALQSHRGAMRPFFAEPDVAEALRRLASRAEATPFMVLLAAFKTLLHRYTGQEDVVVGSPVAVLGSAEAESLVGLFTNMLVLRSDLSGDPGFRELLRRVREVALGAYSHQDLPFERLVEELRPERDLSRPPIFQVMFALQNTGGAALDLPGLTLRPFESGGSGAARFDLTLDLTEGPGGVAGTIEYNLDLFEAATIDRLGAHLGTLLAGIAAEPDRRLSELPLLTAGERRQALAEWNDSARSIAGPPALHRQIEAQVERSPDAVALISGGVRHGYRELDRRAACAAGHLRSLGIGPESRVGVSLHRSADLVTALLAVLKAGAAYVPLDPGYPAERLAYVAEDSGLAAVLVEPSTAERFAGSSVRTVLLTDALRGPEAPSSQPVPESAAYVIYTSGSTGRPKGVVVSHGNAVNFFTGMDAALLSPERRPNGRGASPGTWLAVTSVSFDISVLELLWTLSRGFTVVVQPDAAGTPAPAARAAAPAKAMDFSLFYFAADEGADAADRYRLLLAGARFADEHGFAAVWTPERHFHAFGGLYPNPSITGAALAGVTRRTQIRAGSVVLPLHNPIRVAEEWSLVDNLSGGRVGVSFASGWNVNDFTLAPENYKDRKDVMFRHIETVRALWRGEAVRVPDGAGQIAELSILPRPIQPELPVWVTAAGNPETFRAAGEAGANLLTHLLGQSLPELAGKIASYREARRQHPDGGSGHVTLMLHAFVGEDLDAVRDRVREPFKSYLRTSLGLLTEMARTLGKNADLSKLAPEEMDALLTHAFDRYFEGAGLMGTVESCLETVERLKEIGVDEVACLIDFGVETGAVLDSLERLDEVRRRSHRSQPAAPPQKAPVADIAEPEEDSSVAALIRRHGVTHLQCTPSMANLLAADPESLAALGTLRQLLLGGEALPETLVEKLPDDLPGGLLNMYGPTETTVWSATHRVEAPDNPAGGTVPLGRPIANTGIVIADPASLQPRPAGVPGELLVGGLGVTRGYLGRPDLTAERFVPDPFSGVPGARLYRTGDLARQRPDGVLEFRGRLDHQLKIRGYRIEPGEVEAALALHPTVRESVVAARQGATAGAEVRLVAYLVPREGVERTDETLSVTALRAFLLDRLPEPLVPSAFVLLDALPLTPNGKVDRKALPAPEGATLGVATAWVAPQNELERAIAGVWQEVLRVERVGIHDNFFELGGTSLTIAQVHAELRRTLKRDFSMVELFRHPTIGALARHLAGDDTAAAALAQVRERTAARAESLEKRREARRSQRDTKTAP